MQLEDAEEVRAAQEGRQDEGLLNDEPPVMSRGFSLCGVVECGYSAILSVAAFSIDNGALKYPSVVTMLEWPRACRISS